MPGGSPNSTRRRNREYLYGLRNIWRTPKASSGIFNFLKVSCYVKNKLLKFDLLRRLLMQPASFKCACTIRSLERWRTRFVSMVREWLQEKPLIVLCHSLVSKVWRPEILKDWEYLQISDHFYYMCTKFFSNGEVHVFQLCFALRSVRELWMCLVTLRYG